MNKKVRRLRMYVTTKMARQITGLGKSALNTAIKNDGIEVVKIGGMLLINRSELTAEKGEPRWPPHLGTLDIDDFVTSSEAAEILGVTSRRITDMASNYEIVSHDLTYWGGQVVYSKGSVISEKLAREAADRARELKNTPKYRKK